MWWIERDDAVTVVARRETGTMAVVVTATRTPERWWCVSAFVVDRASDRFHAGLSDLFPPRHASDRRRAWESLSGLIAEIEALGTDQVVMGSKL